MKIGYRLGSGIADSLVAASLLIAYWLHGNCTSDQAL